MGKSGWSAFAVKLAVTDTLTRERRSEVMSHIRSRNTTPELEVRKFMHRTGLRFRVHVSDLPGKPDIVFVRSRICVFVHGCFWHGCSKCIDGTRRVKTRTRFWQTKVAGNRRRDAKHARRLRTLGWKVRTIWECEIRQPGKLKSLAADIAKQHKQSRLVQAAKRSALS